MYAERIQEHRDAVAASLRRCGVEAIPATTGGNYLPALKAYFKARRRRKA
jgi:hypothetical protein